MPTSTIEMILTKLPSLFLGATMLLMIFFVVPDQNHDEMLSIVSGFLGLLTGRALTLAERPPAPPPDEDKSGPQQ